LGERLSAAEMLELLSAAHGGMLETSVMLHLRPDLVKTVYAHLPRLTRAAFRHWRGRAPAGWPGYVGSPAQASGEWGGVITAALVDAGASLVLRIMAEGRRATREARALPRVPFWLTTRRLGMSLLAAGIGAGALWITSRYRERVTSHD
jgi:hypothetical protein